MINRVRGTRIRRFCSPLLRGAQERCRAERAEKRRHEVFLSRRALSAARPTSRSINRPVPSAHCTVCLEVIHVVAIEARGVSACANDHATLADEQTTALARASATSQLLSAIVSAVRWLLTRLPSGGNTFHEGPSEFQFPRNCITAGLTKLAVPFPPSATTFT